MLLKEYTGVIRLRINKTQIQRINQLKLNQMKKDNRMDRGKKADKINISSHALDFKKIEGELSRIPEIRSEKVESLKKQVKKGTYSISPDALAKKILDSI